MYLRGRKINTNKLIGLLLFSLLIIFTICFFLKSDYFNLYEVKINGNSYLSEGDIRKLLSINNDRNIFSYNLKELEKNICNSTYIKECSIKRKLPNKLLVMVEEENIIGPLYNGEVYCLVDGDGNYVDKLKEDESKNIVINIGYTLNNKKIEFDRETDKRYLIVILKSLENNNILKQVKSIDLTNKDTINIKTKKGLKVAIDKNNSIDTNIDRLNKVLIDLQNRKVYTGSIDMRYNNYILYKP